jgi:hypothetical protein
MRWFEACKNMNNRECKIAEKCKDPNDFWSCVYQADGRRHYYNTNIAMRQQVQDRAYYLSLTHDDSDADHYEQALRIHTILHHTALGVVTPIYIDAPDNLCSRCGAVSHFNRVGFNFSVSACYDCMVSDFTNIPMSAWSRYYS